MSKSMLKRLAIQCPEVQALIAENERLKARNAFLEDVFANQAKFIEQGIDRELENNSLRATCEQQRALLKEARDRLHRENWADLIKRIDAALGEK